MRLIGRILAILAGLVVMVSAAVCVWVYFYATDLPSLAELTHAPKHSKYA